MTITELLEDLLTEFDEFDMQPMLPMPGDPIEKAKAWKHELEYALKHLKAEVAREIFAEIERILPYDFPFLGTAVAVYLSDSELKKKYIGEQK